MNLDHPNKNEQQMKETLQRHEFPFDPLAWQNMQAKLAGSSAESTPGTGHRSSDSGLPPGTSFTLIILFIMTTISVFSIALWFGLATPDTNTATTIHNEMNRTTATEMTDKNAAQDENIFDEIKDGIITEDAILDFSQKNTSTENTSIAENRIQHNKREKNAQSINAGFQKNPVQNNGTDNFLENRNDEASAPFFNMDENGANVFTENKTDLTEKINQTKDEGKSGLKELDFLKNLPLAFLEMNDSNGLGFLTCFSTNPSPNKWSNVDIKFGVGHGLMGTNDNSMLVFQSEITKKWHRLFSSSFSANYGIMYNGLSESASMFHADLNMFISPFGNQGRGNFKIGTGGSFLYVDDVWLGSSRIENGVLIEEFNFDKRKALGYNVILEYERSLGEKYLLGFNASFQEYFSGDVNSALRIKFGVRL